MKLFSKFKQFSRTIKLVIISALIMSSFIVYAAGECIISATADDVSYNSTTVQAAIDELYNMATHCPEGYTCGKSFINEISNGAVLDNIASTYVSSSTGIDFSQISSDTNGKGLYIKADTKDDTHPIYYYRGDVNNNNVKFAGFCWKIVRTTETGGIRMIYNGEPDVSGNCTATETDTTIGSSVYNSNGDSVGYEGYMSGTRYIQGGKKLNNDSNPYVFGNDVTYSNGTYTLTNTMTSTGTWSNDYLTINNYHYSCFTSGTTCSEVYYIFNATDAYAYHVILQGGKKASDALVDMLDNNTINSDVKTFVDSWYRDNMTLYTDYLEDSVYCNDRSINILGGWNPNGGPVSGDDTLMTFNTYDRAWVTFTPSLSCRNVDKFTVSYSKGNGALTYPVSLLNVDEVMYAGGRSSTANNTYYLFSGASSWINSPVNIRRNSSLFRISETGVIGTKSPSDLMGVRPVITLSSSVLLVNDASGTTTDPYVVLTN